MCLSDLVKLTLGTTIGMISAGIPSAILCARNNNIDFTTLFQDAVNTLEYLDTDAAGDEGRQFMQCTKNALLLGAAIGVTVTGTSLLALRCFKNICWVAVVGVGIYSVTLLTSHIHRAP